MPFSIEEFLAITPHMLHMTHERNLGRIAATRKLESARQLLEKSSQPIRPEEIRPHVTEIEVEGATVALSDQNPILDGNIKPGGWTKNELAAEINKRVFFWRINSMGKWAKTDQGQFKKYKEQGVSMALLRMSARDLIAVNPDNGPQFCGHNSGSPGARSGEPSARDESTFIDCQQASFKRSKTREITFTGEVNLPPTTEVSKTGIEGAWSPLFPQNLGA